MVVVGSSSLYVTSSSSLKGHNFSYIYIYIVVVVVVVVVVVKPK